VGELGEVLIANRKFKARGDGWQWCSNCLHYEHFSGLVPYWWESDLEVFIGDLDVTPEAIQAAVEKKG
jgi:hypothetical protein